MYNSYFDNQIRSRGFEYYKLGKVTDVVEEGNKASALVTGTGPYNVEVVFNESDDRIIEYAKCDCRYFSDTGNYCKHIYATILSVKYSEEREIQENLEEEKALEGVKSECEKYIALCKKVLKRTKRKLIFNSKYLTDNSFNDYIEDYELCLRNYNSNVELVHKDSKFISYYNARLDSLKRIYGDITENLTNLNKDIQNGKKQAIHTKAKEGKNQSILGALLGFAKAFVPDTDEDQNVELKVGDWVEITTEGEYGEILNIYNEGFNGFKYEVLFDRDVGNNEVEDIDIFRRDELMKIKII